MARLDWLETPELGPHGPKERNCWSGRNLGRETRLFGEIDTGADPTVREWTATWACHLPRKD